MGTRFKTASSAVVIALTYALSVFAQAKPGASQQDIVEQLLPGGAIPKEVLVKPEQRDRIIRKLKVAKAPADTQRAQQVAFLMAALDEEYDQNRDYLLHVLSGCNYPEIRFGCDDMTGFYLIYLWEHGHQEILGPLLKTSIGSYNAAGSEGLGAYFGRLVEESPVRFLDAVSAYQLPTQRKACYFAGASDGGGIGAKSLAQVRQKLRGIGSEIALRCLKEIEDANKSN
jgi:hypothetical protein